MAKRICDPTSGKIGSQVYMLGRNGQVVRTRVIPSNPNTSYQSLARAHFTTASAGWDELTQAQQLAWINAAAAFQSRSRLGMSGPITGNQFFVKVNANLLQAGAAMVTEAPDMPAWAAMPVTAFSAASGSLVFTTTGAWPASTRVLAAAPVKNGVHREPALIDLGPAPVAVANQSDITALYTARFGAPPDGSKVFVALQQTSLGFDGPPVSFNDIATV